MLNKVYLIKCYYHDYTYISETVHSAYATLPQADQAAKALNLENRNPIQDDGYGPYRGEEYVVEEIEIKGLKCV